MGGGGVFGASHVGIVHALEQRGFAPDLIIGTSVGALTGAIAAAYPDDASQRLDDVWAHLRRREVFPLDFRPSRASLFVDRGLRRLISQAGLPQRIEDLAVPFTAVAMDLDTGAPVLIDHGDLESALLASAAIPGILPPVDRDGRTLVDGGLVAHVPVVAALDVGAASAVVMPTGPESTAMPPAPRRRAGSVVARAGRVWGRHQIERDLHEVSQHIPTIVVPTGVDEWPAPWDFRQSQRLITTAVTTAGAFLDGLQVRGSGLYRVGRAPATDRAHTLSTPTELGEVRR
jgi:NTE family protein